MDANPKEPEQSPLLAIAIILILVTAFTAGVAYQNSRVLSALRALPPGTPTPTPNPFPSPRIQKDESTGRTVYTNYEYGFLFGYPANVFVYSEQQPYAFFLSNKENGKSPWELGSDGLWLNVSYEPINQERRDYFASILAMKNNTTDTKNAVTKLTALTTPEASGAAYFQGLPPNVKGEAAYSYEAVWISETKVYRLTLGAPTEKGIRKYKSLFDDIVSSFTFIRSQEASSS